MSHSPHDHNDPPPADVSPESIREGYEPLGTNTRAVGLTMLIFFIMAGFMMWGLWALMGRYLVENQPEDAATSAAPALSATIRSPLEPMPMHNDSDWQVLVRLRNQENLQFHERGWQIDPKTGEAVIPVAILRQHELPASAGNTPSPLRFLPPMAPVPAGPMESVDWANLFPPVGPAGIQEKKNDIVIRDSPATQEGR